MSVLMVRSTVKADSVAEVEAAVRKMFAEIEAAQPRGVRYASCLLPDGMTFVAILELEGDGDNPLAALPAFREFQESLKNWVTGPPQPEPMRVVGSYRLFGG